MYIKQTSGGMALYNRVVGFAYKKKEENIYNAIYYGNQSTFNMQCVQFFFCKENILFNLLTFFCLYTCKDISKKDSPFL